MKGFERRQIKKSFTLPLLHLTSSIFHLSSVCLTFALCLLLCCAGTTSVCSLDMIPITGMMHECMCIASMPFVFSWIFRSVRNWNWWLVKCYMGEGQKTELCSCLMYFTKETSSEKPQKLTYSLTSHFGLWFVCYIYRCVVWKGINRHNAMKMTACMYVCVFISALHLLSTIFYHNEHKLISYFWRIRFS